MTTIQFESHAPITGFEVQNHCLVVGTRSVTDLVAESGQTPLYLYDRDLISQRIALLRRLLPDQCRINYAVKANPMPELVRHVASLVDGLDVASVGELTLVGNAGVDGARVSFAGPCKRNNELEAAVNAGATINIESERELEFLHLEAARFQQRPKVAIRVNPPFQLRSSGMKMSGGAQQFGIDSEDVPGILRRMKNMDIEFIGFHIFSGSQNLHADAICEAQNLTIELAIQLASHAPAPVKLLNIGGGFGVPYFRDEQPLDIESVTQNVHTLIPQVADAMPQATVALELGRYLVAEAGVYLCRVIDRKVSRGRVFLVTDGGLHHNLAASGNFGQIVRKNYPVVVANKIGWPEQEKATVVGPLCTPLDLLADRMQLAVAEPGDLIAVFQSGAYGRSASPLDFLGHPHPAELLI
ncbi:MAG: pyridoxal-dependent decarboxylase, exosortase A system-associated [Gammaproteobacteria bacterium]|nr:pyridoxal-dependent decarboxylase, exosortase A system-associated [Gammaproteobacteria bacterium]